MTTYRVHRNGDAPALVECIAELQEHERRFDPRLRKGEEMAEGYLRQLLDDCGKHAGTILVAEDGGHVVGFVCVFSAVPYESLDDPRGSYAVVSDLVVRREARSKGIGTALLQEAERFAKELNATVLHVAVRSANADAVRFYRRFGFAPFSEFLIKPL